MADIKQARKRMKKVPFDVKRFRHNETEVVTRGGEKVTILTVGYPHAEYPVVGVINYADGGIDGEMWREDGTGEGWKRGDRDLFLLKPVGERVKVELWANVYQKGIGRETFETKELAQERATHGNPDNKYLATVNFKGSYRV